MIRVLNIDDSAMILLILKDILEGDPEIEVVGQAKNGQEGVEFAERLKPDLITMDVTMPVMDGLEATRQIMARNPTPIIMVTAQTKNNELNVAFEAIQAGALDVLAKPENFGVNPPDWENEFLDKVKRLAKVQPKIGQNERSNG